MNPKKEKQLDELEAAERLYVEQLTCAVRMLEDIPLVSKVVLFCTGDEMQAIGVRVQLRSR